jgi:hypothetical protein
MLMRLFATGLDDETGDALFPPLDEDAFHVAMEQTYGPCISDIRELSQRTSSRMRFRGEIERLPLADQGDPRVTGWTYLVARDDPNAEAIAEILEPLARHRGMHDPRAPLIYEPEETWWDWLDQQYFGLGLEHGAPPHYVLIVGEPTRVPFHFQAVLDSAAAVGRVAFDDLEQLRRYVQKLIDIETAALPLARSEAVFWAPDGGPFDATHYSRAYMARPLADYVRTRGFEVNELFGENATKESLLAALSAKRPALVYTASHGLGPPTGSYAEQQRLTGALCGQHQPGDTRASWLITADDVPESDPFLEGGILFQFACYGYGVPSRSDFAHWINPSPARSRQIAGDDFVSSIPKRLLANPRGPVAFIGHVDTAWLHGFADPDEPDIVERWSPRLAPFKRAVDMLLAVQPAGLAMSDFNKQYDIGNAMLASYLDRLRRNTASRTREARRRLVDQVLRRSDAQNYMVFGDPAARLRISQV